MDIENQIEVHTLSAMTEEHFTFIKEHSEGHIRQVSYNHYRETPSRCDMILEARSGSILVGLTAADLKPHVSEFHIVVVHKDYRKLGLAMFLIQDLKTVAWYLGSNLVSVVAKTNEPGMRVAQKMFSQYDVLNDVQLLFHD